MAQSLISDHELGARRQPPLPPAVLAAVLVGASRSVPATTSAGPHGLCARRATAARAGSGCRRPESRRSPSHPTLRPRALRFPPSPAPGPPGLATAGAVQSAKAAQRSDPVRPTRPQPCSSFTKEFRAESRAEPPGPRRGVARTTDLAAAAVPARCQCGLKIGAPLGAGTEGRAGRTRKAAAGL